MSIIFYLKLFSKNSLLTLFFIHELYKKLTLDNQKEIDIKLVMLLKNQQEIINNIQKGGSFVKFLSKASHEDRLIIRKATVCNNILSNLAKEELKNYRQSFLIEIQKDPFLFIYCPKSWRNDKEIFRQTFLSKDIYIDYASKELRNDRLLVLEAVQYNGFSLEFASERLKNDKEIVLKAIENDPYAFCFASSELKNDKELFLKAILPRPEFVAFSFLLHKSVTK